MLAPLLLAAAIGAFVTGPLLDQLEQASERIDRAFGAIDAVTGPDTALSLSNRLSSDVDFVRQAVPVGSVVSDWQDAVTQIVRLDLETSAQVANGTWPALSATPGLHEAFVRSTVDGKLQPVAVYVPEGLAAGAHAPLVIALHGLGQTESELLGSPFLRRLADQTGSIVAAPYGRGIYAFAEPAATDVYDVVAAAQKDLPVDRHRTYLVGYSMGGYSVFAIGPRGGRLWTAAMCVSGALHGNETSLVRDAWFDTPTYVVTGAKDAVVPAVYGERTAALLGSAGVPVSFYEEPNGDHRLRTLWPSLQRAWLDMHAGTVRRGTIPLMNAPPPPSAPVTTKTDRF